MMYETAEGEVGVAARFRLAGEFSGLVGRMGFGLRLSDGLVEQTVHKVGSRKL